MIGRRPQLILVPALAMLLTACGDGFGDQSDDPEYVAVCTDPRTNTRVDDSQCDHAPQDYTGTSGLDTSSSFMWWYLPTTGGYTAPPVGQRVTAGTYTAPRAASGGRAPVVARSGAVPAGGGAVVRGGFGAAKGGTGS